MLRIEGKKFNQRESFFVAKVPMATCARITCWRSGNESG
jgi:hypothetical protein